MSRGGQTRILDGFKEAELLCKRPEETHTQREKCKNTLQLLSATKAS